MIVSYMIRKNKKQEINIKLVLISCLILVIYSFYPKLVYNTFALIKCISLDETQRVFLEIDPNIQCWESDHYRYLLTIFLPNLLIYCVGWPLLLFSILYRKKVLTVRKMGKSYTENPFLKNASLKESVSIVKEEKENLARSQMLKSKNLDYSMVLTQKQEDDIFQKDKMYSYITIDYGHNTYYWDTFFFGSNLILISVSVFSNKFEPLIYIAIIMLIFSIMLMISINFDPFRYSEINYLMNLSIIALIITFCCVANLTFLGQNHQTLEKIYFAITLIANGLFYFYWLYLFINSNLIPKITAGCEKISSKFKKNTNSIKSLTDGKDKMTTSTRKPLETVNSEDNNFLDNKDNIQIERIDNEKKSHFSKNEELKTDNFMDFQDKIMMSENVEMSENEEKIPKPNKEPRKEISEKPSILHGDNISIYDGE